MSPICAKLFSFCNHQLKKKKRRIPKKTFNKEVLGGMVLYIRKCIGGHDRKKKISRGQPRNITGMLAIQSIKQPSTLLHELMYYFVVCSLVVLRFGGFRWKTQRMCKTLGYLEYAYYTLFSVSGFFFCFSLKSASAANSHVNLELGGRYFHGCSGIIGLYRFPISLFSFTLLYQRFVLVDEVLNYTRIG